MTEKILPLLQFVGKTVLCFVVVQSVLLIVCHEAVERTPMRFSQIARGNVQTSALVVGNSRGVRLMLADHLHDERVFNLSYGGLRRSDTVALVKDFFSFGNHADMVILELSTLVTDAALCELKPFWSLLPHLGENGETRCKSDAWAGRLFPLTRFNAQSFRRAVLYLATDESADQNRRGAFRQSIGGEICDQFPVGEIDEFRRSIENADYTALRKDLESLQVWLAARAPETRLVVVLAPFLRNEQSGEMVRRISVAAQDGLQPRRFLDLTAVLPIGCDGFSDGVHLNQKGIDLIRPILDAYLSLGDQGPATVRAPTR